MSDSDKFTTTRPCSPDEVPAWAKDGTKRHNRKTIYKRTSLAPGWCQKPVIVLGSGDWDEVPYWHKARKYTEVNGAVTGVVEV